MTCRIFSPGIELNVINTHLSAFSTDDTKRRQLERYIEILREKDATGLPFITGGDYNLLPPNSDSLDYCDEDKCPGETYHQPNSNPMHKEGSNYAPEVTWLTPLYAAFQPSLPLDQYKADQHRYFTHATDPQVAWDRTLDYLFSNRSWIPLSHIAHQQLRKHSDHVPVSAYVRVR
jgi:endonuclease/exonuclease/phosphatase family metal-dependent hydrolase